MTEQEWLNCTDPHVMLNFLRGNASERKLRLFAVGCCRRLETELPDQTSWNAIHMAEWCADGHGSEADLLSARRDAEASYRRDRSACAAVAATADRAWDAAQGVVDAVNYLGWEFFEEGTEQEEGQTSLLRDLFGPLPFRPAPIDPAWLCWNSSTVSKLAQAIYDDRVFDCLPILADALEEAGCDNADILNHCSQPGEHVRGCWVVDLLLNKS